MGLLAERLATAPKGRGHSCSIGILLATWPGDRGADEDYEAIMRAMSDPTWTGVAIAKVLREEGYVIDARHIQVHRRRDCTSGTCPMPNTATLA